MALNPLPQTRNRSIPLDGPEDEIRESLKPNGAEQPYIHSGPST